ncbi:MAG: TauD/TfdA family dioxygenase [Vicinamibacteria bacterium]|nr:TauD/TfdA family dioxygenase [Vicinamibacteria bacterium]
MRDQLASLGYTLVPGVFSFDEANDDPWGFAARILGERPALVERQPIRPISNGRSFASSMMVTPFHTDSQLALGVPPMFQLMLCVKPAESGGESLFCDTWAVLDAVERADAELYAALFEVDRHQPFLFGDVHGPTVSRRGGHVVFTHSALAVDRLAVRLAPFLARAPVIEVRPASGDLLVANNHRLLHGRRAFNDPRREFVRLLVYANSPFSVPEPLARHVLDVPAEPPTLRMSDRQTLIADEMIRGAPPGLLSRREGVPEADLYRWRDAVLANRLRRLAALAGVTAGPSWDPA